MHEAAASSWAVVVPVVVVVPVLEVALPAAAAAAAAQVEAVAAVVVVAVHDVRAAAVVVEGVAMGTQTIAACTRAELVEVAAMQQCAARTLVAKMRDDGHGCFSGMDLRTARVRYVRRIRGAEP